MRTVLISGVALATVVLVAGPLIAGPERVTLPEDFESAYTLYNTVDRPDRKRIRFMYVKPEADAAAEPGQAAPDGTVVIMADRAARLDADENPVLDADGRFIPEGDFLAFFVMEKQAGWGETVPADVVPNGDWDYAFYKADRTLNAEANTAGCFACHANRSGRDFTFTYFKNVLDRAGAE